MKESLLDGDVTQIRAEWESMGEKLLSESIYSLRDLLSWCDEDLEDEVELTADEAYRLLNAVEKEVGEISLSEGVESLKGRGGVDGLLQKEVISPCGIYSHTLTLILILIITLILIRGHHCEISTAEIFRRIE